MLEKPVKLRGDLICLSNLGGDPAAVLAGSGVAYVDILAQNPLPQAVIADLFDRLARLAPRGFAIASGRALRVHHLGMLGYRLSNCPVVGDILRDWVPYSRMLDYPLASRFEVSGGHWRMQFRPRFAMSAEALAYCYESTFGGFCQSVANMSGIRLTLETCGLPFAMPENAPDYAPIGAGRLRFDTDYGYVEGPASELAQRVEAADPQVLKLCDELCCAQLARYADLPLSARIREYFAEAARLPDLGGIAAALGESPRSVQRKLAGEGASFQMLLDVARRERATQLLAGKAPLKVIAFKLGFSDVGSLRRVLRGRAVAPLGTVDEPIGPRNAA